MRPLARLALFILLVAGVAGLWSLGTAHEVDGWRVDSRRPGGIAGQGAHSGGDYGHPSGWHEDGRRPGNHMGDLRHHGGGNPDHDFMWHVDGRRPGRFTGESPYRIGAPDHEFGWKVDSRRPGRFSIRELAMVGDSDGDGVPDDRDRCPGTPRGARVDDAGCPSDEDGDGVLDGIDRCPGTPRGAMVDSRGCPEDSDGDGVPDGIDRCPETPRGARVDDRGCPQDSDGDGVPDGIDRCPETPRGVAVDDRGCPEITSKMEEELLDTGTLRLDNVYFELDKAELKSESRPVLNEVGEILIKWPQLRLEVGGHTDSQGSDEYNLGLSDRRAAAVRDYLLRTFPSLRGSQLTSQGYGEVRPIDTNATADGRARNRRVEFTVLNREVLRR